MELPSNLPQKNNIVAWWRMDETSGNRADSSGNSNTLTDVNTVGYTAGKIGNCASFASASSEYFTMGSAPTTGTGDFSICAWVKTNSSGVRRGIVSWGTSGPTDPYKGIFFYIGTDNKLHADVTGVAGPTSTNTINSDNWVHVALVHTDSGDTGQLYINGSTNGSSATMQPNIVSGTVNRVGISYNAAATWEGEIDELIIWNSALTSAEVDNVYDITAYRYASGGVLKWVF